MRERGQGPAEAEAERKEGDSSLDLWFVDARG